METNTQSPVKNGLSYGLITGVAMIIVMLILHLANLYLSKVFQYLVYVALIAGMYLGTKNYRDKIKGGFLSYGQAFFSNFMIGLFAGILYIIFFYIYISFINPGMIDEMMVVARQTLEEGSQELTEEQLDMAMSMQEKFMSPIMLTIFGFLGHMLFSTAFALIVAIFLKKKDPSMPVIS